MGKKKTQTNTNTTQIIEFKKGIKTLKKEIEELRLRNITLSDDKKQLNLEISKLKKELSNSQQMIIDYKQEIDMLYETINELSENK